MLSAKVPPLFASLTLALLTGIALPAYAAEVSPPKTGEEARPFTLAGVDGQKTTLADLVKQGPVAVVVLRGWPGYHCPLCTLQAGDFLTKAKSFDEAGATVVMIYPGPARNLDDHAREFVADKKFPANVRLVVDPDLKFTNAYGLRWDAPNETAYPATFVVDADGKIVYAKVSDGHGGRASAAEVLEAVPAK